jgi:two-component system OmpR family sensor kinase
VDDDGPGMNADDRRRAFERFWRGGPGRSGPGSGLGLSIVAGIVAADQGEVELTTVVGAGSKVRVIIPSLPVPADAPPPVTCRNATSTEAI